MPAGNGGDPQKSSACQQAGLAGRQIVWLTSDYDPPQTATKSKRQQKQYGFCRVPVSPMLWGDGISDMAAVLHRGIFAHPQGAATQQRLIPATADLKMICGQIGSFWIRLGDIGQHQMNFSIAKTTWPEHFDQVLSHPSGKRPRSCFQRRIRITELSICNGEIAPCCTACRIAGICTSKSLLISRSLPACTARMAASSNPYCVQMALMDRSSVMIIPSNPQSSRSRRCTAGDREAGRESSMQLTMVWLTRTLGAPAAIPA